jgi:hypothetical protein
MKTNRYIIDHEDWDLPLWFAILNPLIGIALGLRRLFVLGR